MTSRWIEIGDLAEVPSRGARVVRTSRGDIAVFRAADDRIFALNDRCPHMGGPLSQGIVHGHSVTCPLHNWVIGLADGQAQGADSGCTRSIPVKVEQGKILLRLSIAAEAAA